MGMDTCLAHHRGHMSLDASDLLFQDKIPDDPVSDHITATLVRDIVLLPQAVMVQIDDPVLPTLLVSTAMLLFKICELVQATGRLHQL